MDFFDSFREIFLVNIRKNKKKNVKINFKKITILERKDPLGFVPLSLNVENTNIGHRPTLSIKNRITCENLLNIAY